MKLSKCGTFPYNKEKLQTLDSLLLPLPMLEIYFSSQIVKNNPK